jgi:toxin FitB
VTPGGDGILLDTNVLSEWTKPRPDPAVVRWLDSLDEDRAFISVASLAEIRAGTERMPQGRRRRLLSAWLTDDLPGRFEGRVLPIDRSVADRWGVIVARGLRAGVTIGTMDGFFAATAATHRLTLATRNVRDFQRLGIPLLNPWLDAG